MTEQEQKGREAFEKWATENGLSIQRHRGGFYWNESTERAWQAWEYRDRATPAQPVKVVEMNVAARDVLAERKRQLEGEGWTPEHDGEHDRGELGLAAACYASPQPIYLLNREYEEGVTGQVLFECAWPWDSFWWKRSDKRRNLVKAGALILAEIERLDRLEVSQAKARADGIQ